MCTKRLSPRLRRSTTQLSIERLEDRSLLAAYSLTDLGTLGGGGTAPAYDINEAGQVVGYATTASLKYHAFLWDDGVMTDLGTLPTGSTSKAFGLNNNGQVVGYAFDGSAAGGARNHAFLWENGVMTDIFPEPAHSVANAINDAGQVVGQHNLNHPYLWEDGEFIDLGGFAGSDSFGYALDINNAGQVVGSSGVNNGSDGLAQHAFLWEDGVMTDLGALPGLPDSRAHAINALGQVVGFSSFFDSDTTDEIFESFLYSNGEMIDLGVPGDANMAHDINDHGQIVGWAVGGAYIYENGVVTNLNTLIPAGSGMSLSTAMGINNAGQIIGYALSGGETHAFLLTPILPGDFNSDGVVDAADYVVWRQGLGTTYAQDDFNTWRANFGATLGGGAGAGSSEHATSPIVPEPASVLLLVFGAAAMCLPVRQFRAEPKTHQRGTHVDSGESRSQSEDILRPAKGYDGAQGRTDEWHLVFCNSF
jgi:probable HAF family extracellular repeat protein